MRILLIQKSSAPPRCSSDAYLLARDDPLRQALEARPEVVRTLSQSGLQCLPTRAAQLGR